MASCSLRRVSGVCSESGPMGRSFSVRSFSVTTCSVGLVWKHVGHDEAAH